MEHEDHAAALGHRWRRFGAGLAGGVMVAGAAAGAVAAVAGGDAGPAVPRAVGTADPGGLLPTSPPTEVTGSTVSWAHSYGSFDELRRNSTAVVVATVESVGPAPGPEPGVYPGNEVVLESVALRVRVEETLWGAVAGESIGVGQLTEDVVLGGPPVMSVGGRYLLFLVAPAVDEWRNSAGLYSITGSDGIYSLADGMATHAGRAESVLPKTVAESKALRAATGDDDLTPAQIDELYENAQRYRGIGDLRDASTAVVRATVETSDAAAGVLTSRVAVDDVLWGSAPDELEIEQPLAPTAAAPLTTGRTYLLFLTAHDDATYRVTAERGSWELERAQEPPGYVFKGAGPWEVLPPRLNASLVTQTVILAP
ncbi:hypothetical protein [Jiangella gansuensis]|uniref:hypothetical protein n=1 Tax=Jiangella gansuensis TaxID=281473 RepID=UPI00047E2785|nr:hypothetical protein [Jiangella gansuensis]